MSDVGASWYPVKLISTASVNNTTLVVNAGVNRTPSCLGWLHVINLNTAPRYLKFYNKPSPTVGTDVPILTFAIPGWGAGGAGYTINVGPGTRIQDPTFLDATGLAFATTTGGADNDTGVVAAGELIINIGYSPG